MPPRKTTTRGPSAGGHLGEVALEVAEHAVDAQPRVLLDELLGARPQHGLGDVERDVAVQRPGVVHRVEQQRVLAGTPEPSSTSSAACVAATSAAALASRIERSARVG